MRQPKRKTTTQRFAAVPVARWFQFLEEQSAQGIALPLTILFSLFVRWCVGLYGYSGYNTPPMYGDYEAQRHWMEITNHLPPSKWYFYDLQYWGLDYPPLTAFQSWLCGYVANLIDPSWVALDTSRGIETHESKLFMRASVIVLEFVVYIPAVVMLFRSRQVAVSWAAKQAAIFSILLQPCLLLIDNGHFQYNSVMLGFLVWAVHLAAQRRYLLMAVMFSCSLMFKQMALYFAPPVFFFLLATCFQRGQQGVVLFAKLGITVVATFAALLLPWITSPAQLVQILIRVFPVARGLYEDKVANVWCAVNVAIKLRAIFDPQFLLRLAAAATSLAFAPSCVHLFLAIKRQRNTAASTRSGITLLCYSMLNSSLAFFLFSFQVHEKTILLPLMPALLLICDEPWAVDWFVQVALFSMYPLLFRDGLQIPYWVMAIGWSLVRGCPGCPADSRIPFAALVLQWLSTLVMVTIHAAHAFVPPPASMPDLYVVLNVVFSCTMFVLFLVYFNYRQLSLFRTAAAPTKQKAE
ncbi:glucosyltransferase required for N-linked glycosylation pathway [Martensiomyces pterosporus]|nr:glucosyltransferase required for N-linked glycosylation pathway [Martensiomyces pterosporus]